MNHEREIPILDVSPSTETEVQPRVRPSYWLHALLFIATILTTLLAGAMMEIAGGISMEELITALITILGQPSTLTSGIPFSFTLITILITHEMGHYLTARHYGVPATLPYFIPAPPIPFLIGTFGAFIRMKSPILKKKAILEIGAAGPIAGFVVAIIAVYIGLDLSKPVPATQDSPIKLGAPLIFMLLANVPEGYTLNLHAVAFAGWLGLFVTAMNLIPIGQLDGGHVVYALLGKKHKLISIGMVFLLVLLGFIGWPGWFIWAFLTAMLGVKHPPMIDPETKLEPRQKIIGWSSLVIFVLTFTPAPFIIE